jgi:Fe-S oxidoreductase
VRALAKLAAGMPQARAIPPFAPETFQQWFRRRGPRNLGAATVLLWPDTFNNHFHPDTARAAVEVLEAAGWHVAVPAEPVCCGRPLYDYGMLARAKEYLRHSLATLAPALAAGTPVVVLEPSCAAVFRDELIEMLPERADARQLAEQTFVLSEFLAKKAAGWQPPPLARRALVQGHCHQKAIMQMKDECAVLERMGLDYELLSSGCCGMAGSFGYERDKYAVSIACGERALLPAVRAAAPSTVIVADGFSCREQIRQQTEREALHLAEVLRLALHGGGNERARPEAATVAARRAARRRSMARAAAGVALAGVAVAVAARRR